MSPAPNLPSVIEELEGFYGPPPPPFPVDPFELVLWENVAYLAEDRRKREALDTLRASVGTRPQEILAAPRGKLLAVTGHGILPENFADKLRSVAKIALEEFGGDLQEVVSRPPAAAKKALSCFPGIGEPGSEKILLFSRSHPSLAPESSGLRVMVRLGLVSEAKSYSGTYRAARVLAREELGDDFDSLYRARSLLRRHGKEICRRTTPRCAECPLRGMCPFP